MSDFDVAYVGASWMQSYIVIAASQTRASWISLKSLQLAPTHFHCSIFSRCSGFAVFFLPSSSFSFSRNFLGRTSFHFVCFLLNSSDLFELTKHGKTNYAWFQVNSTHSSCISTNFQRISPISNRCCYTFDNRLLISPAEYVCDVNDRMTAERLTNKWLLLILKCTRRWMQQQRRRMKQEKLCLCVFV